MSLYLLTAASQSVVAVWVEQGSTLDFLPLQESYMKVDKGAVSQFCLCSISYSWHLIM